MVTWWQSSVGVSRRDFGAGVVAAIVALFASLVSLLALQFYRWCKASASGLDPEGEADTSNAQATVSHGTVATWVKDLNPKQLRAVAEECDTSQNPRLRRGATGVVGRGGVADPHGRTGRSGVTSSRPVPGRSRGIKFACGGGADQNGEASGLVPEVLHPQELSADAQYWFGYAPQFAALAGLVVGAVAWRRVTSRASTPGRGALAGIVIL
jgi:hypothetical protein